MPENNCFFVISLWSVCAESRQRIFTCKRSDSGMSECSNRIEVCNSVLFLVTVALLVLPLPDLFAMTCSDSWRSCDSSGMSRSRKTTSKRERRADPILYRKRVHKCKYKSHTIQSAVSSIFNLLEIFRDCFASVVMSSNWVCSSHNWGSSRQRGNYTSLRQTHRLLLHCF